MWWVRGEGAGAQMRDEVQVASRLRQGCSLTCAHWSWPAFGYGTRTEANCVGPSHKRMCVYMCMVCQPSGGSRARRPCGINKVPQCLDTSPPPPPTFSHSPRPQVPGRPEPPPRRPAAAALMIEGLAQQQHAKCKLTHPRVAAYGLLVQRQG